MTRTLRLVGGLCLALSLFARVAHAQTETVEYYGTDLIGSIRIVWDANGNVVGRQDYGPFGRSLFPTAGLPKQGFGGQETDAETDQAYFHARMFQARTGRFTRPDPIQDGQFNPQAWNRYAYALNQPASVVDPDGLRAREGPRGDDPSCDYEAGRAAENGGWCYPDLWEPWGVTWSWYGRSGGRGGSGTGGTGTGGTGTGGGRGGGGGVDGEIPDNSSKGRTPLM